MNSFATIYERAARRKGGPEDLEALLTDDYWGAGADPATLSDDRWLASMAKQIFRSGFVWKIVENKWPGFEEAFHGFEPEPVAFLSEQALDELRSNKEIIRHPGKISAVRDNARMVLDVAADHGSFGEFVTGWAADDQAGLLEWLKKNGSRLGGMTGQYLLRACGMDTFILSQDVVKALIVDGIIDKNPTSKTAMKAVQKAFNEWSDESGRGFRDISRTLAMSVD